jgi:hypothetical protein
VVTISTSERLQPLSAEHPPVRRSVSSPPEEPDESEEERRKRRRIKLADPPMSKQIYYIVALFSILCTRGNKKTVYANLV